MKNLKKMMKKDNGFTLVELVVVIAILAILAAILIPRFDGFTKRARSSEALVHAKQIATAGDALIAEGRDYSATATTDPDEFDMDDVVAMAGEDIEALITAGDASVTYTSTTNGHFIFTYTLDDPESTDTFTATRGTDGTITVTW